MGSIDQWDPGEGVSYLVGLVVILGVVLENFGLLGVDKVPHDLVHLKVLPPGLALGVHLLGQRDVELPGSEKSELNRAPSAALTQKPTKRKDR